jgi:hypothetical protein
MRLGDEDAADIVPKGRRGTQGRQEEMSGQTKEDPPSRDVNNLSRNSSVIARNSGGFGESIYQYRGWKQAQDTNENTFPQKQAE